MDLTTLHRLRIGVALVGYVACAVALADDPETKPATSTEQNPPPPAVAAPLGEVVVEAPEPRYVAPTRRDRIGRIWAPVLINDQGPFRLVLDTGASHSAVNASVPAALGIVLSPDHDVMLRGVTGSSRVPTIEVASFIVGDLEIRPKRLPIIASALGGADGILGTEGLQDKRIVIDFKHDTISIRRSHQERAPPGFKVIPVQRMNGLLVIPDVTIGTQHAIAVIDTGGQGTIANAALGAALQRRNPKKVPERDDIQGATLDIQSGDRVDMPPIWISDIAIRGARLTAGDMFIFQHWKMTREPALLIGMDVLGLFDTLIIDYRRSELQVRMRYRD